MGASEKNCQKTGTSNPLSRKAPYSIIFLVGSSPTSAPAAPCQPVPLKALIANLPPISTPPRARSSNSKALRRFRPILSAIPVDPAIACIQKFELGAPLGVAHPPSLAQSPAGVLVRAPRPIKLLREHPKVGPRSAPEPHSAPELHSAKAGTQTAVREKHGRGTRGSLEAALPESSAVARPRKRTFKRNGLDELLGSRFLADFQIPNLNAAAQFGRFMSGVRGTSNLDAVAQFGRFIMSGVRRIAAPALVAVVVVVGLGLLVSSSGALLTAAEENIAPRAAFLMEDDFGGGARDGWNAPHSLVADESGAVHVEGLTLHRETMGLSYYRMDFEAKVSSGAVGWVIGARDSENYHLYKLEKSASQTEPSYRVVHYPVVEGKADTTKTVSKEVSLELDEEEFHRISVRVREGRILTLINGQSVDYWAPEEWKPGGIGFFGNKGESSLIRYVTAYSNQDFLGLSLAVALDAIRSLQGLLAGSA